MDDGIGCLISAVLIIALVIFVVYVITLIAVAAATIAAAAGSAWGGGWAILNYGKSFKENMIDSNRASTAA
jgi:hypothetical protein